MTKTQLIKAILNESKIHHNISTLGLKLPEPPENAPDEIFWDACNMLVEDFIGNWTYEPENDKGNRNLCGCARKVICSKDDFKKDNGYDGRSYIDAYRRWMDYAEAKGLGIIDRQIPGITSDGACKEHDLWHVYSYGRMGATLYWEKYWTGTNSGFGFKYEEDELSESGVDELKTIHKEIAKFNGQVVEMLKALPEELKYRYEEWEKEEREEKRREAMGYNMTLGGLLEDDNPAIVRLAKGIKKELTK